MLVWDGLRDMNYKSHQGQQKQYSIFLTFYCYFFFSEEFAGASSNIQIFKEKHAHNWPKSQSILQSKCVFQDFEKFPKKY